MWVRFPHIAIATSMKMWVSRMLKENEWAVRLSESEPISTYCICADMTDLAPLSRESVLLWAAISHSMFSENRKVLSDSSVWNTTSNYSYYVWRRIKSTADVTLCSTQLLFFSAPFSGSTVVLCSAHVLIPKPVHNGKSGLWLRPPVSNLFHSYFIHDPLNEVNYFPLKDQICPVVFCIKHPFELERVC